MFIKNKVEKVISKYGTRNPFEIIDILDITLVLHPLHESINGVYQVHDNYPVIYINSNLCYEERIITAAHELGHYFLHDGTNYFACSGLLGSYIKDKSERQAYIFAAELLIEDNVFEMYPEKSNSEIASDIGVHPWLFDFKFIEKLR